MGNAPSSSDEQQEEKEQPRGPPPPKHLLYGCETAEEHYEYIERILKQIEDCTDQSSSVSKLHALGFQFRMVHSQPCTCDSRQDDDVQSTWSSRVDDGDFDIGGDSDDYQDDYFVGDDDDEPEAPSTEFMVPLGTPINAHMQQSVQEEEENAPTFNMEHFHSSKSLSKAPPRTQSSASLFSLATHISRSSSVIDSEADTDTCAIRLFHAESQTLITEHNHQDFIAHGKMYDVLADLCMDHAQSVMMQEGSLQWKNVCQEDEGIRILTSPATDGEASRRRQVLLVITGKGQVSAGIFSRRLLMTSGIEPATALPFVRAAANRDMDIIILDPNCQGIQKAMQVVEKSLDHVISDEDETEIYVLAHSMAGAQFVRFLLGKTTEDESTRESSSMMNGNHISSMQACLRRFKAVAFTDSNHNINWVKKHENLVDFLVGPRSLYIKSHKVHEDAKALGEKHHDCQFWRHRFGDIKTLWAGTNEHALTNYTARFHIWEHFDSFLRVDNNDQT